MTAELAGGVLRPRHPSPAQADGAWISLCGPAEPRPLAAIVRAVDPHLDIEYSGIGPRAATATAAAAPGWTARVVARPGAAPECGEVAVTRISTGSSFAFGVRQPIPITPV